MGAFHEGHRSLMRAARAAHDMVVVSLFVNPLQFGPDGGPRPLPAGPDGDLAIAAGEGVDIVFAPPVSEMYPDVPAPHHRARRRAWPTGSAAAGRPGHFDGVATVVAKLFAHRRPGHRLLRSEGRPAAGRRPPAWPPTCACRWRSSVCPLVREDDGLAMSSRNRNLSPAERAAATVIFRGSATGADLVLGGERDAGRLRRVVANMLTTEALVCLEYAEVVDADTLAPLEILTARCSWRWPPGWAGSASSTT